tara:strand:+ start:714 stop:2111 length:1398 start_codon:yes stop_codon:yes gene_type:complete
MKQIEIKLTIRELIGIRGQINMNPAYQRDYVAGDNVKWQRKLIQNLMRGEVVLPALYVRVNNKFQTMKRFDSNNITEDQRQMIIQQIIEMIDGQQRSRTIYDFHTDVFSLGNMTILHNDEYGDPMVTELENPVASDMMNDFQENIFYSNFLNKKITVVATLGNDSEVHQMFIDLNDLNNMKDQEKRNATTTEVAVWVRDTARLVPHKLFQRNIENKGIYLPFSFLRMNQDEMLAKVFALVDGVGKEKGLGKVNLDKLYKMTDYSGNTKEMKNLKTKVVNILDKVYEMVEDKTYYKLLTGACFLNLSMVVDCLLEDKNVKVTDWSKVAEWFFDTHHMLCDIKNPHNKDKMSGPDLTIFGRKLKFSDKEALLIRLTELQRNGMYDIDGVTLVDPKRVITDSEFEGVWFTYNKKCAGCGEDVKLHEAVKGHIIAHQKGVEQGGVTTIENTVPLHKVCNKPQVENQKVA